MSDIDRLLKLLKDKRGSDLHLSPGNPPLARVSGDLTALGDAPLTAEAIQNLLFPIMSATQRAQYEKTHDLDFGHSVPELEARFRGNVFQGRLGISAVLRLIPSQIKSFQQLGLPESLIRFTELPKGLVLVTGSTGCGKSTTLAALVDHINQSRREHIITVEDPIEFVYPSRKCLINQREVGANTESFAAALRAALREDPDVILVGEMRDLETIELAITAAETGHLVFGTLHTNSAAKAVDRMINVFPIPQQPQIRALLSESLMGVICQSLLKTLDGGRVAALEILVSTPALSNLVRDGRTFQIPGLIQTGKKDGMVSMEHAVRTLLESGKISSETARPYLAKSDAPPHGDSRDAAPAPR